MLQIILLAAAWLLAPAALAQRPATLRGAVADSLSGQPLARVSVGLVGQPGGTATEALGQFRLGELAASTYQVRFGALGYKLKTQEIALVAGETRGVTTVLATTSL